jgi:hypothetical protein
MWRVYRKLVFWRRPEGPEEAHDKILSYETARAH